MNTPHTVRPLTPAEVEALAVEPTAWTVNALPREHPRWRDGRVTIQLHQPTEGNDFYCISWQGHVLNHAGGWDIDPPGELRDLAWFDTHEWTSRDGAFAAARHAAAELARQATS